MNTEKKYIYIISGVILLLFVLIYGKTVLSYLPYFKIKNVEIEGNRVLSKKDILKILNIKNEDSIFFYDKKTAVKKFHETGIVKDIKIHSIYPNTLKVMIRERYPIACAKVIRKETVQHYLIDDEGGIIKKCKGRYPDLPLLIMDYNNVDDIKNYQLNIKRTLYSLSVIYFNNKRNFKRIKQIQPVPNKDKVKVWIDGLGTRFLVKDFLKVRDFLEMKYLLNNKKIVRQSFRRIDLRFDDIFAK